MVQSQAAILKREIEAKLANRIPAALSPIAQQVPRLHPIGNARLDALLGGGLPLGSVCELTGPDGSGHSSIRAFFAGERFQGRGMRLHRRERYAIAAERGSRRRRAPQPALGALRNGYTAPDSRRNVLSGFQAIRSGERPPSAHPWRLRQLAPTRRDERPGSRAGADALRQERTAQTEDGGHTRPS